MPTKYAEVIYETGTHSVSSYDDLDDLKDGLAEQHDRAVNGLLGGPTGHAAERVHKVLLYDRHPGDLNEAGILPVQVLEKEVAAILKEIAVGTEASVAELVTELVKLVSSTTNPKNSHDSVFKMSHTSELPLDFLNNSKEGDN